MGERTAAPWEMTLDPEGLALGVGDHFGETFVVTQPVCQHKGGDHCELEFTWPTEGP